MSDNPILAWVAKECLPLFEDNLRAGRISSPHRSLPTRDPPARRSTDPSPRTYQLDNTP